jgi:hypothetical protein
MKTKSLFLVGVVAFFLFFDVSLFGQNKPTWLSNMKVKAETRQIYFPAPNIYFDIQKNVYIYPFAGEWKKSETLPDKFLAIDLEKAVKVELSLNTDEPQKFNREHKAEYSGK